MLSTMRRAVGLDLQLSQRDSSTWIVQTQVRNQKELVGVYTRGGACSLIRYYA